MIYEYPGPEEPIRQGDIFFGLPRIDFSLEDVFVYHANSSVKKASWESIIDKGRSANILVPVQPVTAIVISQDCDTERETYISLCEVRDFQQIYRTEAKPGKWWKVVAQHARVNQKWFYLPEDPRIGFDKKMGVDFIVTLRVYLQELKSFMHLRKARLNDEAKAHFRERISEFFRRYPYDEWYPLNKEEFQAYQDSHPGAEPRPWQR